MAAMTGRRPMPAMRERLGFTQCRKGDKRVL
ncbi:hypothetical protein U879_16770 [Defluviimonas sp. 20V17]|nr:hypothetical protein U879_16770 [Defluviimonas sp. 20V17]